LAESLDVPITRIGRIMEGQGVHTEGHDGPSGYEHFA
jgi:thiamine-monophosphate kinase